MKKTIFIFISLAWSIILCQAQTNSVAEIFKFDAQGKIIPQKEMIDAFYDIPSMHTAKYTPGRPYPFKVGNTNYTLKTCIFERWDDNLENGFNVLGIYKENKLLLEVKQPDIWTYTYDGGSLLNYKKYTNNRYFIPVTLSTKAKALLFVGWPYGGDMPYLTIIVATENDVKMVFNKQLGIKSIITSPSYKIKLDVNLVEEVNGKVTPTPKYAEIGITKDATLYYKK